MRRSVKFRIDIWFARISLFWAVAGSPVYASGSEAILASAIIREMNLARGKPRLYATYLEKLRSYYDGGVVVLPGGTRWQMKEGLGAIDEAVHFLGNVRPVEPLILSPGMCRAAADHCADQAGGGTGHRGSDRSNPGDRLGHYGIWNGLWGENIAYGKTSARAIVLALLIDDGRPKRPHRRNIFDPDFHYVGAAFGPHALYGSVCTIDFASSYAERPPTRSRD